MSMTAKQYLEQAYRLNELINSHSRELEQLRLMSTSLQGTDFAKDKVSSSQANEAPYVKCINKIIVLEKQINNEIDNLVDLKKEIHDVVGALQSRNEQLVLRCRYIEFLTWEQTADTMCYSIKQIHRIHAEALKNVTIPKR